MIITLTDEQTHDLMEALTEARGACARHLSEWADEQGETGEVFRSIWEYRLKQTLDLFLDIQEQISQFKYGDKAMLTKEQEQRVEQTLEKTGNIKGLEYIQRLKDELRSKVDYIHEQDEIIDDYKHHAEVAERQAILLSKWLAEKTRKDYPWRAWFDAAQKQAEKELAEGK